MDHHSERFDEIDGATKTLQSIEAGGHALVITAHQRIGDILTAIDEGDFMEAAGHAGNLGNILSTLAHAQQFLGIASDAQLVPARELRVGMRLATVGEITHIDVSECEAEKCKGHVKMKIGEHHESEYRGDTEFYVDEGSLPSSDES